MSSSSCYLKKKKAAKIFPSISSCFQGLLFLYPQPVPYWPFICSCDFSLVCYFCPLYNIRRKPFKIHSSGFWCLGGFLFCFVFFQLAACFLSSKVLKYIYSVMWHNCSSIFIYHVSLHFCAYKCLLVSHCQWSWH